MTEFWANDFWIILSGSLVSIICAVLGCFLVLRKMAMIGDAISHAVLPGIVVAFFFSESLSSFPVLIGATILGLITTISIEVLNRRLGIQLDAAIGLVFTFLFAVGVLIIAAYSGNLHLDQDCVLHGEMAYIPFDIGWTINGIEIPRQIPILGTLAVLIIGVIALSFRPLNLTTFDDEFAESVGIKVQNWHYLLMALVSLATVISFESVGAILVVAFLVVPASTAYLLTNRLEIMILLACFFGVLASILGYYLSYWIDGSIAGSMTSMMGLLFVLVFLFSPTQGVLRKLKN